MLHFRGDALVFTLSAPSLETGSAWVRTNIGHARATRTEILRRVNCQEPALGRDWFDIPMRRIDKGRFQARLPLCEAGHFQAKCYFLKDGETYPMWPEGANTVINVEPAETCCANIIYNAFVRQFGPNKAGTFLLPIEQNCIQALDNAGFTVIPPSGTFRDLIRELDFIIEKLGCRIIQLLPVNPTPTTYARMGRFGNPYASLDFTGIDPALAEFDPRATPLEQFVELLDAVHARNAKLFLDIAVNHTGWAASLHESHPEWLSRFPDGRIEVPGAWGVAWEDLTKLDYRHTDLWQYMVDVFLTWCRRGVDGFRADAGYMIPVEAWKYIVAAVREQYPDTVFLLEGLGGKISETRRILNDANFNWAYSELFQNYDRAQIEGYLPGAMEISRSQGIMLHYAETHDNNRMAAVSQRFSRMRTTLCALCSHQGAFGFANGVEWYATEKISVHGASSLNWGASENQVDEIRRLNSILRVHPAFFDQTDLKMIQNGPGNFIVMLRHHRPTEKRVLAVVNLDAGQPVHAAWDSDQAGIQETVMVDLLSGTEVKLQVSENRRLLTLDPGQALCLSADWSDMELLSRYGNRFCRMPEHAASRKLAAKALEVREYYRGTCDLGDENLDEAARLLADHPVEFCRKHNPHGDESRVVMWKWPQDQKRQVMIPPGHFLMIQSPTSFRARIMQEDRCVAAEAAAMRSDGTFFALFMPLPTPREFRSCSLKIWVYTPEHCQHVEAQLLYLPDPDGITIRQRFSRHELLDHSPRLLGTNGRGGMLRAHASWGDLASRYDALLAANLCTNFPKDRQMFFARCRGWIIYQGFSRSINLDCTDAFDYEYESRGFWHFYIPTGQGQHLRLSIGVEMVPGRNAVRMVFYRHPAGSDAARLSDEKSVALILRPDIEDRNFHVPAKAYLGPEHEWPSAVRPFDSGFEFMPAPDRRLRFEISPGKFNPAPEWNYMVYRRLDAERGLDPDSDLFSPGYFLVNLTSESTVMLSAAVETISDLPESDLASKVKGAFNRQEFWKPEVAFRKCLDHYVVKRGNFNTVIAGYPWFLDWGRDTLIAVRGLIAAGMLQEARSILKQFASFEENGTLPNMIRGLDASNRDTADAPLWLFVACSDLLAAEKDASFLKESCGGRTIGRVLSDMVRSLITGTPNGIRMDAASGLLFSPSHFSWMDTNFPAGTPREGYPVEIQALWYFALNFLSRNHPPGTGKTYRDLAEQVRASMVAFFYLEDSGYLADCLYAKPGQGADAAEPDDALRPNQLFALTLGAITDPVVGRSVLDHCAELLVPGAVRSLADRPLRRPLPIVYNGRLLNDPCRPYQGTYAGDEDTSRKPAYHNGTAWTWLLPSFCEAWALMYAPDGNDAARAWLGSMCRLMNSGCAGHVPEILDGNFPHRQRGCDAQAWGISELYRVWTKLSSGSV
ncbi:MAG: amylo-alpha-1,6-glucosidase [Desulfobacterales bacterium]|nr:amylo-alpha-1,6-glucosidase [Desulfobacterales bacterium]MDD3950392.1 amylo-alpha-1,6-glucosidase [Desulfobacterales bacterium]MDD4463103.1 amylo-alpha-1,6-glucosidase [Desulfobacterales bacterium]